MTTERSVAFDPRNWVWGTDEFAPRVLHSMVRVNDFDAASRFYTEGLGMKVLMRFEVPARRVSAMFLGFADYHSGGVLELAKKWDVDAPYTHGTGYGHIAIGVPDIEASIARLEAMGTEVTLQPTELVAGGPRVAFVKDPDGYEIELIQTRRD